MEVGFEALCEVAGEGEEEGFENEPSNECEAGLGEEFPEGKSAEEGGGFKDDGVEEMGEEGGAEGAEPELVEVLFRGFFVGFELRVVFDGWMDFGLETLSGRLADFDEEEVVEALAAPEAEDAGEEDATSHAGNGDEGGIVGAGIAGEGGD